MAWDSVTSRIKQVLETAVHAPSGDNAQPWEFSVKRNEVSIFNVPGKDATLYNFKERGSIFAHGALIENIFIASTSHSLMPEVVAFPDPKNDNCTARILFKESLTKKDPLADFILERATNRKPYGKMNLSQEHKERILAAVKNYPEGEIRLIEEPNLMKSLARSISLNERLIIECKPIHDFLFSIIRWTEKEEREKAGLYIKTLEFSPPQIALFRKLGDWKLAKFLAAVGFPKLISHQSAGLYASSGAIGALLMPNDDKKSFLLAGRIFQRFWLAATRIGLGLQPITAIPYLAQRIKAGEGNELSPKHKNLIMDAYSNLVKIFGVANQTIAMIFRIGYAEAPSARSAKFSPQII